MRDDDQPYYNLYNMSRRVCQFRYRKKKSSVAKSRGGVGGPVWRKVIRCGTNAEKIVSLYSFFQLDINPGLGEEAVFSSIPESSRVLEIFIFSSFLSLLLTFFAMDFFKKQAQSYLSEDKASKPKPDQSSSDAPKTGTGTGTGTGKEEVPSYSELMGSANVLLDAAKQQMGGGAAKEGGGGGGKPMDTAKLAGAAEDVLDAAKHYGKLEGTAYGGYVKKAEDYLHTYQSRDVDVTPEKKEAAAGELKAAAEDVKAKSEVPDKVVDAVQDKIEAAAPPAEKSAAAPPPPKPSDE